MSIIINKVEDLEAFIDGLSKGKTLAAGEKNVDNAYSFASILVEALEHYEDHVKGRAYSSDDVKEVRQICWKLFEKARDAS